ncbi:hypothetical protein ACFV9E_39110, partial [Streptomyces sp. NPDC059835]
SRLMTLYAKTFPGSDGAAAVRWYRMAANTADESGDPAARVWVRGRAAIALGYEGASLAVADVLADHALALSERPSLGLLNAIYGKAHAAALRGDRATALALDERGRRVFDTAGSHEQTSDYAVPWWRLNVFHSLLLARLGDEWAATEAQEQALGELHATLPRFATHLELHCGLMLARSGDKAGGIALNVLGILQTGIGEEDPDVGRPVRHPDGDAVVAHPAPGAAHRHASDRPVHRRPDPGRPGPASSNSSASRLRSTTPPSRRPSPRHCACGLASTHRAARPSSTQRSSSPVLA